MESGEATLDWLILNQDLSWPNLTHLTHFGMQNKYNDPDGLYTFTLLWYSSKK